MSQFALNDFNINKAISLCMNKDRFYLKKRWHQLNTELKRETALNNAESAVNTQKTQTHIEQLFKNIAISQSILNQRQHTLPKIEYPDLPVSDKREDIKEAIRHNQVVIIAGETGSGKTTQIPKMCLELGRGIAGYIGHTQPRRLAARSVATRIAEELDTTIGETVGFKVRFSDQVSKNSLVKLMTDGILLAEIQQDKYLSQYDTIIIDEAHERSLNIDFLLGYFKQLLKKRVDLKLIITSATIDPERFSAHFNNAPIIEVSGRTYPVDIRYQSNEQVDDVEQTDAICHAVDELMREAPGDILVFLSGERDIRDTQDALVKKQYRNTEITPLYARLSAAEQNRIFQSHTGRRIVLATNVAETSLTVPGIKYVIDPGTARISRYSYRSKVQRLPIEPISQASANQRAGRCGRVSDGICIRLYTEDDYNNRDAFTDPEIVRTHLSSVIIQMLSLGLGHIDQFPFVQPPDSRNINDGIKLLEEIQAIERHKTKVTLTPIGRKVAKLPLDPRYARMIVEAAENDCIKEVIIICAGLSVQDPKERPQDKKQAADEKHNEFNDKESDFISLLNLWVAFGEEQAKLSNNHLRKWCKQNFINYLRMREWQDIVSQLKKSIVEIGFRLNSQTADYQAIHTAMASGLLSQLGLKDKNREYLGPRNSKFMIFPGSSVAKKAPQWIMAAELVETSQLFARSVAKIEPEWVEGIAAHLLKYDYSEPHWSKKKGSVQAFVKISLFGLPIVPKRSVTFSNVDAEMSQSIFIREALVNGITSLKYAFLKSNHALVEGVEDLEQKSRRRDLLIDDDDLCDFYQQKLPKYICSEASFKKWWSKESSINANFLTFDPAFLLKKEPSGVNVHDYPDQWQQGNLAFSLSYKFEPTENDDGVSLMIPLPLLNRVNSTGFDWLVPGLAHELVVALIKSLPKRLRKSFVPAPNFADACIADIQKFDNKGNQQGLLDAVIKKLLKMTGVKLLPEDFNLAELSPHLQFNFKVVDEHNKVLDQDRNLEQLKNRLHGKVKETLMDAATPELERQGLDAWDFDELPISFTKQHGNFEIKAFPALTLQSNRIDIILHDEEQKAQFHHRLGVYHLIKRTIPSPLKYLQQKLPNKAKLGLYFNPFGQINTLIDDIIMAAIDSLTHRFIETTNSDIRTKSSFEQLCELVRADINEEALSIASSLEIGLITAHKIQKSCKGNMPLNIIHNISHIKQSLDGLVYKGFVFDMGKYKLNDWQRYLIALEKRVEKLKIDPNKDRLNQLEIDKINAKFVTQKKAPENLALNEADAEEIKWMIEELKVSFFAQQLGTAYPISVKRIENRLVQMQANS